MQALERLRKAGFVPGISPTGGLLIEPASRLTAAQRAYIRAHKVLLVEALRAELAPVAEIFPIAPVMPVVAVVDFDQDAFEERAAILEYDAGFSREEAERRALALMSASPVDSTIVKSAIADLPLTRPETVCCADCAPRYSWANHQSDG